MGMDLEPPWLEELKELKRRQKFIDVNKAAQILGVSGMTVRRLLREGQIDGMKTKAKWLIYIDSFIEFTIKRYNLNLD